MRGKGERNLSSFIILLCRGVVYAFLKVKVYFEARAERKREREREKGEGEVTRLPDALHFYDSIF